MSEDGETGVSADAEQTAGPTDSEVTDAERADESDGDATPTPQSEALRKQQLYVGSGVAVLAGIAATIAGAQQFPEFPFVVFLLGGLAVTTLLFGLVFTGLFQAESG